MTSKRVILSLSSDAVAEILNTLTIAVNSDKTIPTYCHDWVSRFNRIIDHFVDQRNDEFDIHYTDLGT
jgi:hypothetical protein